MDIYIKTMTGDDDKEVVAQACTSVAEIIKDYGYAAIEPCKHGCICSPPPRSLSLSLSREIKVLRCR
jgi:hypothetical protein